MNQFWRTLLYEVDWKAIGSLAGPAIAAAVVVWGWKKNDELKRKQDRDAARRQHLVELIADLQHHRIIRSKYESVREAQERGRALQSPAFDQARVKGNELFDRMLEVQRTIRKHSCAIEVPGCSLSLACANLINLTSASATELTVKLVTVLQDEVHQLDKVPRTHLAIREALLKSIQAELMSETTSIDPLPQPKEG